MQGGLLNIILLTGLFLHTLQAYCFANEPQRAFPGAEGFGANSRGGRNGKVIFVTNTHDSGPGSLRAACIEKGPRVVVFRTSGLIELESLLTITEPYLTIAGQTAPGDGVCIKNYGIVVEGTHDIIIRYLRMRPGDQKRVEQDALWVDSSRDVIIDHCSTSWGTDETLSVTGGGATNVTVQWCMITESLNNSIHHKGPHGYGSLLRVDGSLSFHHNFYAHHSSRNPRPGCYGDMNKGGMLDFRNNVVYNWGERPGYTGEDKVAINLVANYFKPGPSTLKGVRSYAFIVGGRATSIYAAQNVHKGNHEGERDNWKLIKIPDASWTSDVRLSAPLAAAGMEAESAQEAFRRVVDNAGAIHPKRDSVDGRIAREVRENRGKVIDTQSDVGGWPVYAKGVVPPDTDNDAMPDAWETTHGLDPNNGADVNLDPDGDGYTNVEEFLNSTDPKTKNTL